MEWLARCQAEDGGWGETDRSHSDPATTLQVEAAFHLVGKAEAFAPVLERAERFLDGHGGIAAVRRQFGGEETLLMPILTSCALAGRIPWSDMPAMPFERVRLHRTLLRGSACPRQPMPCPASWRPAWHVLLTAGHGTP